MGGGGSRPDVLSLLYLRPAAVLCLAALCLTRGPWRLGEYRTIIALLLAFATLIILQLVPLPPAIWLSLPGHERFAEAAVAVGKAQPWRPLSLTPDLTFNSLLALLPAFVVLVGLAGLFSPQRWRIISVLAAIASASALLGLIQVIGGADTSAYLYRITHQGVPVGFFANRNHQAALLAIGLPALQVWALRPGIKESTRGVRKIVAASAGLFLLLVLIATGSRAGIVLGLMGLIGTYLLLPRGGVKGAQTRFAKTTRFAIIAASLITVGLAIFFGRALSIDRLLTTGNIEDVDRVAYAPLIVEIIGQFFPLGSGFGSFDRVFRMFEPDAILGPQYFNRAHNDLLELALTGGLPALILLGLFLSWVAIRTIAAFRASTRHNPDALLARLGAIMVVILLSASLVDYPLRTPLLTAVFTLACGLLVNRSEGAIRGPGDKGRARRSGRRDGTPAGLSFQSPRSKSGN